jgi:DNA-binding NarL/FixJ family response regulator
MEPVARLCIFHRNRLFGECLASALVGQGKLHAKFHSHTDPNHVKDMEQEGINVVLVDLALGPFAIELAGRLRATRESTRILLLVSANSHALISEAIKAGAHGCVLEEISLRELKEAIARVTAGEFFCSPQLIESLFTRMAELSRREEPRWRSSVNSADLTERELEILCLVADGLSNKQIARRLCLSLYTVKNHVHNVLQKLQVGDRYQAVAHLREHGWLAKTAV